MRSSLRATMSISCGALLCNLSFSLYFSFCPLFGIISVWQLSCQSCERRGKGLPPPFLSSASEIHASARGAPPRSASQRAASSRGSARRGRRARRASGWPARLSLTSIDSLDIQRQAMSLDTASLAFSLGVVPIPHLCSLATLADEAPPTPRPVGALHAVRRQRRLRRVQRDGACSEHM